MAINYKNYCHACTNIWLFSGPSRAQNFYYFKSRCDPIVLPWPI